MENAAQAARNRDAFSNAGLNDGEVATALDISLSYADQLLTGSKPISAPIRAKLDEMIAAKAKADGPAEVETADVAFMQAAQPMPVMCPKYQVIKVSDGYAVVENPIAVFRGLSWAEEYAHWLNEQIRRGKEPG